MIVKDDVVHIELNKPELDVCIDTAKYISGCIVDRKDLHARDDLERFINVLMGEVAEHMVIKWLTEQGKFAESAVDKKSDKPDFGHDIKVIKANGDEGFCSVKSSLSYKLDVQEILNFCKIASKKSELRDINIQVYFWLTLNPKDNENRLTIPSLRQAAIIGWFGKNDLFNFASYNHEGGREAPTKTLNGGRTMSSLLAFLK